MSTLRLTLSNQAISTHQLTEGVSQLRDNRHSVYYRYHQKSRALGSFFGVFHQQGKTQWVKLGSYPVLSAKMALAKMQKLLKEGALTEVVTGQLKFVYVKELLCWYQVRLPKSLVSYGDKNYFRLKPDLYITELKVAHTVLDTKWKLIDKKKSAGKDKFGLSQSDFYQMLGYGHKYLESVGNLVLIYPKSDSFDKPFEHSFNYDEGSKLKLWVVPFDVSHACKKRIELENIKR